MRHVKSSENRAAGASMGGQLRGSCNGQAFRLKVAKTSAKAATGAGARGRDHQTSRHESVPYANCGAARAAGAAPLTKDDPGYDSHLDRDGDGYACE